MNTTRYFCVVLGAPDPEGRNQVELSRESIARALVESQALFIVDKLVPAKAVRITVIPVEKP